MRGEIKNMVEIKMKVNGGIFYECPSCEAEVELGQAYCQDCGEGIDWIPPEYDYDKYGELIIKE